MKRRAFAAATVVAVLMSSSAFGHGGGLDRNGCHTNRKTGEYHCHRASAGAPEPPPPAPTRSASPETSARVQRVSASVIHSSPTTADNDLRRAAQRLLHALGYQPSLLGSMDERTRAAVRAFQRAEKIEVDGVVSEYLLLRLAERVAAKCE